MGRRVKGMPEPQGASEERAVEHPPIYNGLHCSMCGSVQFEAPDGAGITCEKGHGGVEGVTPQELAKIPSAQLAQEIAVAEREAKVVKARIQFGTANAARKSEMREDFKRLVVTIFVDDIETEAKRLIEELQLGELRSDRGSVIKALDRAARNANDAHALYVTCVREREAWEKRNEVILAGMRTEAMKSLMAEKNAKQRSKAITNSDLDSECALLFGDEWVKQENEKREYQLAEAQMKNLSERWADRSFALRAIADALR